MDSDYLSDNEAFVAEHPLHSPAGTPYHSVSRRTSCYGAPGSEMPSSPAPFPPEHSMSMEDAANDGKISVLDPRRFTPTLHANLVSEILNLRRELDSKHRLVEDLETNLHTARDDNESLAQQFSMAAKESRNAKQQLQRFENETLAALEEIAGERDKMKEINADLRSKLEAAQKKSRSQEEDSTRVHDMWAREKEAWTGEKLALERRIHSSDARLKILLDEIALQEAVRDEAGAESEGDDVVRDVGLGPESDTASIRSSPQRRSSTRLGRHSRNRSNSSYMSIGRNNRMSLMSMEGHGRANGISLADELVFDEEDEDLEDLELDSHDFPENEIRARRAHESRQSKYPDEKAKRILGLSSDQQQLNRDDSSPAEESEARKTSYETWHSSATLIPRDITLVFPPTRPVYVDTGVQPSPPPSPTKPTMAEASSQTAELYLQSKWSEVLSTSADIEANQRRKRVSAARDTEIPPISVTLVSSLMTSSSVQTVEQPLSPPATPKTTSSIAPISLSPKFEAPLEIASTQTKLPEESQGRPQEPKRAPPPAPILVPSIAIHAPSSAPSSPKEPILPPGTKTVSTQTSGDLFAHMHSSGMQTEPIRIDQRPVKLPAHLLPSVVGSKPGTPEYVLQTRTSGSINGKDSHHPNSSDIEHPKAKLVGRQDLTTLLEKAVDRQVENRYPGNNDNGPLSKYHHADILNRPFRTSSLFAGFDGPSSDEEDNDVDLCEDEFKGQLFSTPMLSSWNAKNARPFNPPTPVPEDKEAVLSSNVSEELAISSQMTSKRNSVEKPAKVGKPARNSMGRQPSIRRSAMIQNGTATHVRSRSPSIGSLGSSNYIPKPPFPVPTRSSSRNKPFSKGEGSQSPTPRNSGSFAGRRPYGVKHQRKDSLRKVRSAAPVAKPNRSRSRSPTLPATPSVADSMSIPPLPSDVVSASGLGHRHQHSNATVWTANGSVNTSTSQTSVVDAIAASMIGEFMWKYVRKRKAFGGPEASADVARAAEEASLASHGVRHKRWVWISPYERSILWSSKQPTSGSALMGKSGRKLIIQSVLDVADNCPAPKNETLFNRSILILTPARALKFTTTSGERHYLWLTALSFLAHSNAAIPDLASMPPVPPPAIETPTGPAQGATLRRSRVQDSVRLAKGRANPVMQRYASQNDMQTALPSLAGFDKPIPDSASPPTIPRGPAHGRKRSSTGPGAPPRNMPFRSFSHQHVVSSTYSNVSSDMYSAAAPPSAPSSVYNPNSGVVSSRTSEASTSTQRHFFDTMGTVRMEAFIDNALGDPKHAGSYAARTRMHSRRGESSQWSASTRDQHNRTGGFFNDFEVPGNNDPFRGF
ncbi:meiotic cell cortex C-terminal pleckstrin homology-domain-containing protein [Ampelomyces quisqualis]|uniref:Meiotic cell cortex C-terminal pleckstrin homology-domain-containing protein n=1 Tax=Ampelomyces quisqualis TaxID=50730 RepID=A0A6A5QN34_AMPQU|nr:meiotic cell cortex C-terminal pleckstrin homology-domain-containing protein [Ampelomyces quisqualis]